MATVAQLAAQQVQEFGYVLFIEGWPLAFTNRAELTGTGEGAWIGNDPGVGEGRRVVLGLETPPPMKQAIGILESGLPLDSSVTVTITDDETRKYMAGFAKDEAGTALWQRLAPTDQPAPATLIGDGGLNITIWDRWVNGECIGPAGERRQYQVIPGNPAAPYDHAAIDSAVQDLRASTVRTAPRFLEGLPCAVYLIRQDPVTGTWPGWQDQYDSGYSLVWFGTLKSLTAKSIEWKLTIDGALSLLRRTLNANRPADWKPLTPLVEFGPDENRIAASFCYSTYNAQRLLGASSAYEAADTISSGQTPAELAAEINARLQTLAGTSTADMPGGGWSAFYSAEVHLYENEVGIKIANNNGDNAYGGVLALRMHQKAWLALGWDIALQLRPYDQLSTPYEVEGEIEAAEFKTPWIDPTPDPGPGYWTAIFTTCPIGVNWNKSPSKVDGDSSMRYYAPLYSNEPEILYPLGGQTLTFGYDPPYLEGQLARPPADKVLDSGTCDATGYFAVRGTFKPSQDADEETRYQIFKGSWVKTAATSIAVDPESRAVVWLERWLDPRQFGAPNKKLDYVWAANDLEYAPVALLGYNVDAPDKAYAVLLRLLLGSGTAGPWTGYEGDPLAAIVSGDNAHPDATNLADDREIADLGLNIPHSLIDWASFPAAAAALQSEPLNQCRLAYLGPFDSQQAIEDLIKPRGWCFSLRGGRFGIFARNAPLTLDDVEVAIGPDDIGGEPDDLPPWEEVDFRPLEPIDLIEVTYGGNAFDGGAGSRTASFKARDPRAVLRRGNAPVQIDGRSLLPDGSWLIDFSRLWADQLSRWYAEPWALVTCKVKGNIARDIYPGTIVSYTSPWMATRDGLYGKTGGIGRVTSVELNPETLTKTIEILLQAGDPYTARRFAPLARLLDDVPTADNRHDVGSRTLYCYADAWSRGEDASDVAAFAEPAWLDIGGDALVYVWSSWDGLTWEKTAEFEVESVNTAAHSITYKTGSLLGTIYERRYTVLTMAPWEDQTVGTWPRSMFGVVCGTDTKFGAGNQDGYPWVL